jgi:surface antigen
MQIGNRLISIIFLAFIVALIVPLSSNLSINYAVAQDLTKINTSYLPDIYFGENYLSTISIRNIEAYETEVVLTAYNAGGNNLGVVESITRLGPDEIVTIDENELPLGTASIKIETNGNIDANLTLSSLDNERSKAIKSITESSSQIDFPLLIDNDAFNKIIFLLNPNAINSSVTIVALDKDGYEIARNTIEPLSKMESISFYMADIFNSEILNDISTVRVLSDHNITGLQFVDILDYNLVGFSNANILDVKVSAVSFYYPETKISLASSPSKYATTLNAFKGLLIGECTWYVYGRIIELVGKGYLPTNIEQIVYDSFWKKSGRDAKNWLSILNGKVPSGNVPKTGSIAVWTGGDHGHVGFVENVSGNAYLLSDFNIKLDHKYRVTTYTIESDNLLSSEPVFIYLSETSSTLDITLPTVTAFSANPSLVDLGNTVTISYTVKDSGGSGLKQVELWRAPYNNGVPGTWAQIKTNGHLGDGPVTSSFADASSSIGKYYYGIHVIDNAGNWNDEKNSKTGGIPGKYGPILVQVKAPIPSSVSVNPASGSWTSSPQNVNVSSSGASQIFCSVSVTTDGSTPSDPPDPTASNSACKQSSTVISGSSGTFEMWASPGQYKRLKVKFRGKSSGGNGSVSGIYSYSINIPAIPGSVSVNPASGSWTSTPQNVNVSSSGASQIFCSVSVTTDGLTPSDPPDPTASNSACKQSSTVISGSSGTFEMWASVGQYKRFKVKFRGNNSSGNGPTSGIYSYSINIPVGSVSVNPTSGSWTSTPQNVNISSSGASQIFCSVSVTTDGLTPSDPPDPTASNSSCRQSSAIISGSSGSFEMWASAGQHKRLKVKFRGNNSSGSGPTSGIYSYSLNIPVGSVSVNPTGGNWKSSPQYVNVSSSGASQIFCSVSVTTNGSTPSDPPDPTASNSSCKQSSAIISGSSGSFEMWASSGQYKRLKVKFRGSNNNGNGSTSGIYSYSIDRR